MAVSDLDRALPEGYAASKLGQAAVGAVGTLVSECSSPLYVGRINAYVVFVPEGLTVSKYEWTITRIGGAVTPFETQGEGLRWIPKEPGDYTIAVKINGGDAIQLDQVVEHYPSSLARLHEICDDKITPRGDRESVARAICELLPYITEAAATTGTAISARLLCSVAYTSMSSRGARTTAEPLFPAKPGKTPALLAVHPITHLYSVARTSGVCRISPAVAALFLEKTKVEASEKVTRGLLEDKYAALLPGTKRDICNLLRFPKSNLAIAAGLLAKFQADWRDAVDSSGGKLAGSADEDIQRAELATIFASGGVPLAKYVTKKPKDSPAMLEISSFGRAVAENMKLPVFTVLVTPDDAMKAIVARWENQGTGEQVAKRNSARVHFFGVIHYAYLYGDYADASKGIGTPDMLDWIPANIVEFRHPLFTGRAVFNQAIRDRLQTAFDATTARLPTLKFKSVGGFSPRKIAGSARLSNHAMGQAIDVDPESNPHWHAAEMKGINYLLGGTIWQTVVKEGTKTIKAAEKSTYRVMADANADFLTQFVPTTSDPSIDEVNDLTRVEAALIRAFWAGGFLTLPKEFVLEMIAAGFGWGGHYASSRDFMHFDFPPESAPPPDEEGLP
jgi:hypothetical protein